MAVRLGTALWRFWWARGHLGEGRRWLEVVLASGPALSAAARTRSLSGVWAVASHALGTDSARAEQATAFFEESLRLCRELGDVRGVAIALGNLGQVAAQQGDRERARSLLLESLALLRELGDRERVAAALYGLGSEGLGASEPGGAVAALEESLALRRELGDRAGVSASLATLGRTLLESGDEESAHTLLVEGLELGRELGPNPALADTVEALAGLARRHGEHQDAAHLLAAAAALRESMDVAPSPRPAAAAQREQAELRAVMGDPAFDAAWVEGQALSREDVLAQAASVPFTSAPPAHAPHPDPAAPLTVREREVAVCIAHGLTNREIANELVIAEGTVERHVANIMSKLGHASRAQVAAWVVQRGLLTSPTEP
jgi:non-specific serine/threonine protein kinase